jgi:hypothetical protein
LASSQCKDEAALEAALDVAALSRALEASGDT